MKYIVKDITTIQAPAIIIHGVNCQRTMGSGVAKALYEKWPKVRSDYIDFGNMQLGDIQPVQVERELYIINAFTQYYYGNDGKKYALPEAIQRCLAATCIFAQKIGIYDIYMPRIGCGLGGLDWDNEVLPLIERIQRLWKDIQITVCHIN